MENRSLEKEAQSIPETVMGLISTINELEDKCEKMERNIKKKDDYIDDLEEEIRNLRSEIEDLEEK